MLTLVFSVFTSAEENHSEDPEKAEKKTDKENENRKLEPDHCY